MSTRHKTLEITNGPIHPQVPWKGRDQMQMVGHGQNEMNMHAPRVRQHARMPCDRFKHVRFRQRIHTPLAAANGQKKPCPCPYPGRRNVIEAREGWHAK